jgi:GMP synthase-like glutamine amidotransferase
MILIINICKERLHYFEFVRPIEKIIGVDFISRHYSEVSKKDLDIAEKVIICGTSLKDNSFIDGIEKFKWIKNFEKPILGICGGMQVIGIIFGGRLKKKTEIGFFFEDFKKLFLGLKNREEVYHLHNNFVLFSEDFEVFSEGNEIVQAVKHKKREIYGVLFHPEVRQKKMIDEFISI